MHHVLVIDDAATVRRYHHKVLSDAGWSVQEAVNGVEALERVHQQPADTAFGLYLVDINMPRLDGYSFVRALRQLDARHQAPVVMISTESAQGDIRSALSAGANSYLVKPASAIDLVLTVALLLGDRKAAVKAGAGARP